MSSGASKNELLKWLQTFFDARGYDSLDKCASGAMYCQILDAIYPGFVHLSNVNFDAVTDRERLSNYRFMEKILKKKKIAKKHNIEELAKGSYKETLEWLQFLKQLWEEKGGASRKYDAGRARNKAMSKYRRKHKLKKKKTGLSISTRNRGGSTSQQSSVRGSPPTSPSMSDLNIRRVRKATKSTGWEEKGTAINGLLQDLTEVIQGLEEERNSYFQKLRDIEVLTEKEWTDAAQMRQRVQEALYASPHNDPPDIEDSDEDDDDDDQTF